MLYKISEDSYLAHHGIKGQKWGQQNGPPYPLGQSDRSAAERKKNPKVSEGSSDSESKKKNQNVVTKTEAQQKQSQEETKKKEKSPKELKKMTSKNIDDLSNEELRAIKDRINLEQEYKKAIQSTQKQKLGSKLATKFKDQAIDKIASKTAEIAVNKLIDVLLGKGTSTKINTDKNKTKAKAEAEIKDFKIDFGKTADWNNSGLISLPSFGSRKKNK